MNLFEQLYIADLIVKAIAGSLSGEEAAELRLWRESSEENERLYQELLTMGGMELLYLCRRLPGKCYRKKYRENGNTGSDRIY